MSDDSMDEEYCENFDGQVVYLSHQDQMEEDETAEELAPISDAVIEDDGVSWNINYLDDDMQNETVVTSDTVDLKNFTNIQNVPSNIKIVSIKKIKINSLSANNMSKPKEDIRITHTVEPQEALKPKSLPVRHIKKDALDKKELLGSPASSRPKKGRRLKIPGQTREERKKRANTNKAYVNARGEEVQPRQFNVEFSCMCPKKCTDKVPVKTRQTMFNHFWNIGNYEGRCAYIHNCVNELPKKRNYAKNPDSRRKFTRKYYLKGQEVCKITFLNTLQINSSRVNHSLKKQDDEIIVDKRGKASGGKNALSEEKVDMVINHIASFPQVSNSTKSRNKSGIKYISTDLTLNGMFNAYCDSHIEPVSRSSYKKIFYERFNLRFRPIKKEMSTNVSIKYETIE